MALANADEALAAAVRTSFDVALVSDEVSDIDGRTLAAELGARLPGLPLILTSRDPRQFQDGEGRRNPGGWLRLAKPFTAEELIGVITTSLRPEDDAA